MVKQLYSNKDLLKKKKTAIAKFAAVVGGFLHCSNLLSCWSVYLCNKPIFTYTCTQHILMHTALHTIRKLFSQSDWQRSKRTVIRCSRRWWDDEPSQALLPLTPAGHPLPHRPPPHPVHSTSVSCGLSDPQGLCMFCALYPEGSACMSAWPPSPPPLFCQISFQSGRPWPCCTPGAQGPLLFFPARHPLTFFIVCLSVMIIVLCLFPPLDCKPGETRDLCF